MHENLLASPHKIRIDLSHVVFFEILRILKLITSKFDSKGIYLTSSELFFGSCIHKLQYNCLKKIYRMTEKRMERINPRLKQAESPLTIKKKKRLIN